MSNNAPPFRPFSRVHKFRILASDERRTRALEEYLQEREEVRAVSADGHDGEITASLMPRTDPWEVEEAAAAGGFPIVESRLPLDSIEGRLEILLIALTIPATALSFLGYYYNVVTGDLAMLLGAFIVFICGYPILKNAVVAILDRKFGSELLLGLAVLAPLPYSYLYGQPFYYASGIIILISQASGILNRYIEPRYRDLGFFLPTEALDSKDEWISLEGVKAGDVLKVKPGFHVPADGTVTGGEGTVVRPGSCAGLKAGSEVDGGSLLTDGTLLLKAARDGGESRLKKTAAALVKARKPIEVLLSYPKSIERALILVTMMGVAFVFLFFGNMMAAVAILIASAPCAALIARPLSLFACYLAASRSGAGYVSHGAIERMSMTDTVAFDGLGSVVSDSSLTDVAGSGGDVKAAVAAYKGDDPTFGDAKEMEGGYSLLSLAEASKVTFVPDDLLGKARSFEMKGKLTRYAFKGASLLGVAAFELTVPEDLKASVERFGKLGVKNVMLLTGEPSGVSDTAARKAGIGVVKSRMDAGDRLEFIAKMVAEGKNVLAAGRGCDISRFAANAAAVTIKDQAMGFEGLEDAICASPSEVPGLLSLSKKEVKRTSEGMSFGFYFNTIAIIAASTQLVDAELVLLMVVASVVAIATNSARMYFSGLK
jgi:cation transport ATPase